MTTATMNYSETNDTRTDEHFLERMHRATAGERDAVFAQLAMEVEAGSELAARTIRQLLLPTCTEIAAGRSDEFLAAVIDAALDEVLDWARTQ